MFGCKLIFLNAKPGGNQRKQKSLNIELQKNALILIA